MDTPFNALLAGIQAGRNFAQQRKLDQGNALAGRALQRRDYDGAANAFFGSGQFDQGAAALESGQQERSRALRQGVGQQLAQSRFQGDPAAANIASAGDFDLLGEYQKITGGLEEAERSKVERARGIAATISGALLNVPAAQRQAALPQLLQRFQGEPDFNVQQFMAGLTPDQLEDDYLEAVQRLGLEADEQVAMAQRDRAFEADRADRAQDVAFRQQAADRDAYFRNQQAAGGGDRSGTPLAERDQLKLAQGLRKGVSGAQAFAAKSQRVLEAITKAREQAGGDFTTGLVGRATSAIAGSPAYNLDRTLDTIKANVGFAELTEMRANSPTGGALGSVTERELQFLQSTIASLDQSQSREQLVENLGKVEAAYRQALTRIDAALDEDRALAARFGVESPPPAAAAVPASRQPPPQAIARLRADPRLAQAFERKYGVPAADYLK